MPQQSYEDLLKKVKAGQGTTEATVPEPKAKVEAVCKELGDDLKDVALENAVIVRELLETKFLESGYQDVSFRQEALGFSELMLNADSMVNFGSVIVGQYPKAAFNVYVVHQKGKTIVYFFKVRERGNFRG